MKKILPDSGFTLIELMVVMTVMAMLSTMLLFGLGKAQAAARDAQRQQIMTAIQTALERYYADNQAYPSTASGSTWHWGELITMLIAGGYLTQAPVDPKSGCVAAAGIAWVPCGGTSPVYRYIWQPWPDIATSRCKGSNNKQSYELVLTKESGGTSYFARRINYFSKFEGGEE
jgi:prepilin-type N-terminal cleavage/methylation domain-containing protein